MQIRAVSILTRRMLRRSGVFQVALLIVFALAGEHATRALGLPVPGGVAGMALMLAMLASRRMGTGLVRRGSSLLLGDMLLFFVPAVMALLDHGELIGVLGLKLLAVIVMGTIMVMGATALAIDACYRWSLRHAG